MALESFSLHRQYNSAILLGGLVTLELVAGMGLKVISKIERSHDSEFADATNTAGNISLIAALGTTTVALVRGLLHTGNSLTPD